MRGGGRNNYNGKCSFKCYLNSFINKFQSQIVVETVDVMETSMMIVKKAVMEVVDEVIMVAIMATTEIVKTDSITMDLVRTEVVVIMNVSGKSVKVCLACR